MHFSQNALKSRRTHGKYGLFVLCILRDPDSYRDCVFRERLF